MNDRALIIVELHHRTYAAKRDMPKVGDEDHPTPWDLDHRRIDELLDKLAAVSDDEPARTPA